MRNGAVCPAPRTRIWFTSLFPSLHKDVHVPGSIIAPIGRRLKARHPGPRHRSRPWYTVGPMRWIVAIWLLAAACPVAAAELPLVSYEITLLREPELEVRVRMSLASDSGGTTTLEVDDHWGGVREGGRDIERIGAAGGRGEALEFERPEPHEIVVHHDPGERIVVSYSFLGNDHQSQNDPSQFRRPVLNEGLFHTVGHLAWFRPAHIGLRDSCRVRFEWRGFEEAGWRVVTSWGTGDRALVTTLEDISGSLYVAGDFALMTRDIRGYPLTVTVAGSLWGFEPEEFATVCASVVELERAFFDDFEREFYWISLVPAGTPSEQGLSIGGTGLVNCFSMGVTPNAGLGLDEPGGGELLRILAHEMFHEWNGLVILREEPEELVYWFSEGFTDFYARRLLYRGGWMSIDDYAASASKTLERYTVSPVRNAPNTRILDDYWNDSYVQRLPYLRGDIVAMIMDDAIRRASGSRRNLDDLMREIVADARDGQRVGVDYLIDKFAAWSDAATADAIREVVVDGDTAQIPRDLFRPCLEVRSEDVYAFDLGFDLDRSIEERFVMGVREGSAAYAAGLRDGQPLAGWSIHHGDVDRDVVLEVYVFDERRTISYLPRGEVKHTPKVVPAEASGSCDSL